MTAISPCPLATNITAIGFISRDIDDRRKVFLKGLVYTAGRAVSYFLLALILFLGASRMNLSHLFQGFSEKILAPLLIIFGLLMLDVFKIRFPAFKRLTESTANKSKKGYWNSFLLGIIFALAFCPYSGVLFFGILIPLAVSGPKGLYLPVIFAIATGLPVVVFSWIIAYSIGRVGKIYNRIKTFELWFRRVVAVIFILVGIYYLVILFIW